jgi:hypothetical protein
MTEWSKVHVWKACEAQASESSNLSLSVSKKALASQDAGAFRERRSPGGYSLPTTTFCATTPAGVDCRAM